MSDTFTTCQRCAEAIETNNFNVFKYGEDRETAVANTVYMMDSSRWGDLAYLGETQAEPGVIFTCYICCEESEGEAHYFE